MMELPSREYIEMQKWLTAILDKPGAHTSNRRKEIYNSLHKIFMSKWGLKKSNSYRFRNFSDCLDHTTAYRDKNGYLVLVTQPYCFTDKYGDLKKDCEKIGASVEAASGWAFYYPGHAGMAVIYLNRK